MGNKKVGKKSMGNKKVGKKSMGQKSLGNEGIVIYDLKKSKSLYFLRI